VTNNTFLLKITVPSRLPFYNNATAKAMEQETDNKDCLTLHEHIHMPVWFVQERRFSLGAGRR